MPLSDRYLEYPKRHYGMDHDRYDWLDLFSRAPVEWPNGARIALSVVTHVQWFPLDMPAQPFKAPGALSMPYPDYRYYTNRDYGNRVGLYRILDVLAARKLKSAFAVNGAIAQRYPALVQAIIEDGHEIVAHGLDMGKLHHSGLSVTEEKALIAETLRLLRAASRQKVEGWLSPGRAQSWNTLDLLAENGVSYALDWANDDMPYAMRAGAKEILAMPLAHETDDRVAATEYHHSELEWVRQVKDRFDLLYRESETYGGRVMSLPLHSWISGMPYRIAYLEEVLDYIQGHEGVWSACVAEIAEAFRGQALNEARTDAGKPCLRT